MTISGQSGGRHPSLAVFPTSTLSLYAGSTLALHTRTLVRPLLRYHNQSLHQHPSPYRPKDKACNRTDNAQENLPEQNKSGIMSDDEQMDMGGDDYQQDFDPDELK